MNKHMDVEHFIEHVGLLVGTEIALIVGLMTHVFILAVTMVDWKKMGTITISDQVILSIVISKMVSHFIIQLNLFWEPSCDMDYFVVTFVTDTSYDSAVYAFIWLSTLLSVVFYLKISNLHNAFLSYLKILFSKRILHIILAVALVSVGLSAVNNGIYYKTFSQNSTQVLVLHDVQLDQARMFLLVLLNLIPLFICFLSSMLLIISLCFHINQMKCNNSSAMSLDVYYRTIKFTTISATNCALYVTHNILIQEYYCFFDVVVFNFILTILSTSHSLYMIFAISKLKKWFYKILYHKNNCLTVRREPNSTTVVNAVTP